MFKKNLPKLTIFAFLLIFASIVLAKVIRHSTEQLKNTLKAQLKEEIRQELSGEITQLVKQEMESYLASDKLAQKTTDETPHITRLTPQPETKENTTTETKQAAIERIVKNIIHKEIRELKEAELDAMIASGSPQEIMVAGASKRFELAQADTQNHSTKAQSSDLDVTGGEKKAESLERALIQRGGILLPKGKLQLEPSLTWAHFSSNRINIQGFNVLPVIVIGHISTETVKRDIFIQNNSIKYGLLHNLQGEIRIPLRLEHDRTTNTDFGTEKTQYKKGIGDIEMSLSRQIGWEHGFIPDLLATVSVKSNTGESIYDDKAIGLGTGHWAVRGGLVAVKSSDPAVVFGAINYTLNMKRDITGIGEIDPGDSIGYSIGTAIALSYQTAINFSFDHSVSEKTLRNGGTVAGTFVNSASLKTGFTWAINEKRSVDFGVAVGLTTDAPDTSVTVSFPYTF